MIEFSIAPKFIKYVDRDYIEKIAFTVFDQVGEDPEKVAFLVKFSTNRVIRELNRKYRDHDEPTDVLSFPERYLNPEDGLFFLGEIVISVEKAMQQAEAQNHDLQSELHMLFVHGLLHLCNYDHIEKEDFLKMSAIQDKILSMLNNPLLASIFPPE